MTTSSQRRGLLLLIPLVLLILLAWCNQQPGTQDLLPITPIPNTKALSASDKCPQKPPEEGGVRSDGKGLEILVPPGATRARLCRYYALAGPGSKWVRVSRVITDEDTIERITSVLNSDPPGNRMGHSCVLITHTDDVLALFSYRSGNVNVEVDMTGCGNPTNGQGMAMQLEVEPRVGLHISREFNQLVPVPGHPHLEERFYQRSN